MLWFTMMIFLWQYTYEIIDDYKTCNLLTFYQRYSCYSLFFLIFNFDLSFLRIFVRLFLLFKCRFVYAWISLLLLKRFSTFFWKLFIMRWWIFFSFHAIYFFNFAFDIQNFFDFSFFMIVNEFCFNWRNRRVITAVIFKQWYMKNWMYFSLWK